MFWGSFKCGNVFLRNSSRPGGFLSVISWKPHILLPSHLIHCSRQLLGLEEFFDIPENYTKLEVRVGRSWRVDELRLKSNSDLHKLWYVLLKERNMLLTMKHIYSNYLMPSPERTHKVEESMKNLEEVVRERNRAYFELETGESGERRSKYIMTRIGLWRLHKLDQHPIPKSMNKTWQEEYPEKCDVEVDDYIPTFLSLYREKQLKLKAAKQLGQKLYVLGLLRRFPNIDLELLQEQYPHLNIKKLKNSKAARGHFPSDSQEERILNTSN